MTIQQALDSGRVHHQAGRLREAEAMYRAILTESPTHPDALHMLGILAHQAGRNDLAADLINRAIAGNPQSAFYHRNLGMALAAGGQLEPAIAAYQKAFDLRPDYLDAVCELGNAQYRAGKIDQAIESYHRGLALLPTSAQLLNNLGTALQKKGSLAQAIECFKQAIELDPNIADPYSNLGNALVEARQLPAALAMLERAVAMAPSSPEIQYNLANVLRDNEQSEAAITAYHRAIALRPTHLEALNNLGNLLKTIGRVDESITWFRQALSIRPADMMAWNNIADAFHLKGDLAQAESCCRKAIEIDSNVPITHWDLALTLLLQGRLSEGWKEYAWRRKVKEFEPLLKKFSQPQWDGSDLHGKSILLHPEQGFGDTIQFLRYLPMVKSRGAKIIYSCEPELRRLIEGQLPIDQLQSPIDPLLDIDVHCSLLDLPMVMDTNLNTIPAEFPYLTAKQEDQEKWRDRLAEFPGLKVGLAWAGKPIHRNDRNRSMPLSTLLPLLRRVGTAHLPSKEGVGYEHLVAPVFFSLQKGSAASQISELPSDASLVDWTDDLRDFADTAALIANLDLVISVDTAVVHLAGAMGKPIWVMLPFAPDWRWMTVRDDSPWYPSARLFRQPAPGDWTSVVQRINQSLKTLADTRA
jgi:tetratricopeptide (TPR) repeat protein